MKFASILILRILIVILIATMVLFQALIIPLMAGQYAESFPEAAYLRLPFTVLLGLVILGAEIVLICVWVLLTMARKNSIFNRRTFRFVDTVIVAFLAMGGILAGIGAYLQLVLRANPPLVAIGLIGGVTGCFALAVLVVVMRGLLKQATNMDEFMRTVA